tara:strand:- start:76 stop:525 length:450 start_codon:yes stop_codon:yes gene_type:complete
MELINQLLKKGKQHELALLAMLVLYILFDIKTPHAVSSLLDNVYGNVVVLILAFYVLLQMNSIVGVVALIAAYELIRRSSIATGSAAIKRFLPSELKKGKHFSAFNQFPVTLEEEMVDKMAPLVKHAGANLSYKPVEDDSINASNIHSA